MKPGSKAAEVVRAIPSAPRDKHPDLATTLATEWGDAARLAAIIESSDAIITKDLNGIIRSWNNGAERMFGYTAEEVIGQHVSMLAVSGRVEEIPDIIERVRGGEKIDHYQAKRSTKDGRVLDISLTVSPIRDVSGEIIGASTVARDITAQKNAALLQEQLAAIVESSDDVIISKDLNGVIRSWNSGAERIFGYTAEEAIGQPISILAVPERVEEIADILSRIRRGEKVDHYETKRRTKDGRVLDISLTVSPIRDVSGEIIGASKVARDITDQKRRAELQERLAAIVESSDDAIISKDLSGVIQSWNSAAERIFGYTAEEAIGQPISMLAVPERVEEMPEILSRIRRGEKVDHYETRRRAKDGRVLDISLTVSPIRNASGQIIGASKIARDVTQRKRLEREVQAQSEALTRSNEELRRANADLEQFAFSASHDLKEPLRMVAIYSQILRRKYGDRLDSEALQYVDYVLTGAKRMDKLVQDLLAYTKSSAPARPEEPLSSVDADGVLKQAISNLTQLIAESGARIETCPLPTLQILEVHLLQLFQNLIENAIKYRRDEPPRIKIDATREQKLWRICVHDNGIGIAPEYKEQVFGLFKRLHPSDKYDGTGIGLALCQRLVSRYGGRIWVESEGEGKGSTFCFTLPGGDLQSGKY